MPPSLEGNGLHQKLSGVEKMTPICPASCADGLFRFVSGLNGHIRNKPGFLPLRQILCDKPFDCPFPFQVRLRRRGEIRFLPLAVGRALADPLNGVKPLLKNIVRSRFELVFFPSAQSIGGFAVLVAVIPAQRSDRGAMNLAMERVDHLPVLNSAFFGFFELSRSCAGDDFNVESFVFLVGNKLGANAGCGGNHPCRGQGDHPARLGATGFQAIQEILGPVALGIMLDAQTRDFLIDLVKDRLLFAIHLGAKLGIGADDVESAPSEHAGDGVEVGCVGVAAQARRLKGDRAPAAKRVAHLGPLPVAQYSQLLDKLDNAVRMNAQMGVALVDVFPNRGVQPRLVDLLRPADVFGLVFVRAQGGERPAVNCQLFLFRDAALPSIARKTGLSFFFVRQLGQITDFEAAFFQRSSGQALIVHRHELFKQTQIRFGVARRGQQASQNNRPRQNQRLAPLPIRTQPRQRLRIAGFALRERFKRDLSGGKDRFDQSRRVFERKRG